MPDIQWVDVRALKPNPRNARTHSKKQIGQIADSLLCFSWTCPLLVDDNFVVLAGHGRLLAAQQLGWDKVPVIILSGLNEVKKRALMLADNKIAANAGWDRNILAPELSELSSLMSDINLDIDITGFSAPEIDMILSDLVDPESDPADACPTSPERSVSRSGDLWSLGQHRLVCADARLRASYEKLMLSSFAAMVFTDPPYNVRIGATVGRGKTKYREFSFASGEMSPVQFKAFLKCWMHLCARFSTNGSVHFICMGWRQLGEILPAGKAVYGELKNLIVWAKTNAGQGSFYRSQHELILPFINGDAPHQNNIELGRHGRNRSNVWSYPSVNTFQMGRPDQLTLHPTIKPVALVADAIRDCSRRGDIVLDPFMGSGTTILAAERVGRRAFGLEIDALYVDVAIRRWQSFTGKDAILEATGQTFDEVAAAHKSGR
jgi:DNA modification methylase